MAALCAKIRVHSAIVWAFQTKQDWRFRNCYDGVPVVDSFSVWNDRAFNCYNNETGHVAYITL